MAAQYVYQGDDFDISFAAVNSDRDPLDLTDATLHCEVRASGSATTVVAAATFLDSATGGLWRARFGSWQTTDFQLVTYLFDGRVVLPNGEIHTVGHGSFIVLDPVTQEGAPVVPPTPTGTADNWTVAVPGAGVSRTLAAHLATLPDTLVTATGSTTARTLADWTARLEADKTLILAAVPSAGSQDTNYQASFDAGVAASALSYLPFQTPGTPATMVGDLSETVTLVRTTVGEVYIAGAPVSAASGQFRVGDSPMGILIEPQRTQSFVSPDAPATQTITLGTGDFYAYIEGTGSMVITAGTITATGLPKTITARTPGTFNASVGGTIVATISGTVTFAQVENGSWGTSRIHAAGTRNADVVTIANPITSNIWSIDFILTPTLLHTLLEVSGTSFGLAGAGNYNAANSVNVYVAAGTMYVSVVDNASAARYCAFATPNYFGANASDKGRVSRRITVSSNSGSLAIYVDGIKADTGMAGAGTGLMTTFPATMNIGRLASTYAEAGLVISDFSVSSSATRLSPPHRQRWLWLSDSILNTINILNATSRFLGIEVPKRSPSWSVFYGPDWGTYGGSTSGGALLELADYTYNYVAGFGWSLVKRGVPLSSYSGAVVEYGSNELETGAEYQRVLDKIASQALRYLNRFVLSTPPPFANAGLTAWDDTTAYQTAGRYAAHLAVASKWNLKNCDMVSIFKALTTAGTWNVTDLMRDQIHPSYDPGSRIFDQEIAKQWNSAKKENSASPTIPGRVVNYLFGIPTSGAWAITPITVGTAPPLTPLQRIAGLADSANVVSASGAVLTFPTAVFEQLWAHMLVDSSTGGAFTVYVDKGTANEKSASFNTLQAGRTLYPYSGFVVDGLSPSVTHTVEIDTTSAGPVRILGVTYVGVP